MIKTLTATLTVALSLACSQVKAASFVSSELLNGITIPAGWQVVNCSEPFAFGPFLYVRVYLFHPTSRQVAIWKINLDQP